MRLTNFEQKMIIQTFLECFESGNIYLFGSRVDDTKKGGDIDLYLVPSVKFDNENERKIDFLVKLKNYIGEQKIDVVMAKDKNRLIEQVALKEGILLDEKKLRVQKYINECEKHSLRIEKSHSKVKNIFPLSATKYVNLSDDEVEAIDQYLFRFAKLQDTLGNKLFKLVVSKYIDNIEELTFLDILNHLEKVGVVKNVNVWKKLRAVRNDISHQYDDEAEEMAEALNNILAYKDELLCVFESVKKEFL